METLFVGLGSSSNVFAAVFKNLRGISCDWDKDDFSSSRFYLEVAFGEMLAFWIVLIALKKLDL